MLRLVIINLLVLTGGLVAGSLVLRYIDGTGAAPIVTLTDRNTIRASYPVYDDLDRDSALSRFSEFGSLTTAYQPFTGWRREPFQGAHVTVEEDHHTRMSIAHATEGSTWFLGGSTVWGTGVDNTDTIPSLYAAATGQSVWNLGESGYNSFQGFVQLGMRLVQGHTPAAVIVYEGINDSIYCNTNNHEYPTHARRDRFARSIRQFPKLQERYRALKAREETDADLLVISGSLIASFRAALTWLAQPVTTRLDRLLDKRVIGADVNESLVAGTPWSTFNSTGRYRDCHESSQRKERAAQTTVDTWFLIADLLEAHGIPYIFVLQPSAHIATDELNIDYLLDSEKQRIADERSSFNVRYAAIRSVWQARCLARSRCDRLIDLSGVLRGDRSALFIDALHVGPAGNRKITSALVARSRYLLSPSQSPRLILRQIPQECGSLAAVDIPCGKSASTLQDNR